jgi:hypothetical protein
LGDGPFRAEESGAVEVLVVSEKVLVGDPEDLYGILGFNVSGE